MSWLAVEDTGTGWAETSDRVSQEEETMREILVSENHLF